MKGINKAVGIRLRNVENFVEEIRNIRTMGYNFALLDKICTDEYATQVLCCGKDVVDEAPFAWCDVDLLSSDWSQTVIAMLRDLSSGLEGCDTLLFDRSKRLLMRELEFTQHLGISAVVFDLHDKHINLCRIVKNYTSKGYSQQFWALVPISPREHNTPPVSNGSDSQHKPIGCTWERWNQFRTLCDYDNRLFPVLEWCSDVPDENIINKWLGEQVKCIFLPTSCFVSNSSNYPVLSYAHKVAIRRFMEIGTQIIIDPNIEGKLEKDEQSFFALHRQYMEFVADLSNPVVHDKYSDAKYVTGYDDYLQNPLQPLQDNLESHTYETFEKDPVKYNLYTKAVAAALVDLISTEELSTKTAVVMLVGAGRGPIVESCRQASIETRRKIKMYAIEKNANAANTLLHKNKRRWNNEVTVVNVDMREYNPTEKADIIVSELIGSFGDNELSPECLDGAQKFLAPNGIMIPQSYTSYISPVMTPKIYNGVRRMNDYVLGMKTVYSAFETPYVVYIRSAFEIAEPKQVFHFSHPKEDIRASNDRFASITFDVEESCVMHGFAGYFESSLYGDIKMSILPKTFSEGMFSWFPFFFPIREPVTLKKGTQISAHFWRCSSRTSVWYEWSVSSPVVLPIHNSGGRSYTIGL